MGEIKRAKLKKTFSKTLSSGNRTTVPLDEFDYSVYHDLNEINTWIDQIGERYANFVTIVNISRSFEGRVIRGFKISVPSAQRKKAIWFDGGIHSREWVSPASVIYMTKTLLTDYGVDENVTRMLDTFDFYTVPVVNVDGYVYTFTKVSWLVFFPNMSDENLTRGNSLAQKERFWRKTRSTNPNSTCIGADPNRNWDSHFCEQGASNDPVRAQSNCWNHWLHLCWNILLEIQVFRYVLRSNAIFWDRGSAHGGIFAQYQRRPGSILEHSFLLSALDV